MNNKGNSDRKKSTFLILMILFIMFSVTSTTYAYMAFTASNNSVVVGEVGTANLSLTVSRITPSSNNGVMVPQLERALGTAVSSQYNCVDDNGNVVCHVYKIDVKNTGTSNLVVKGTIDFINTSLPNLKYKLMTDATTLDSTFNSRYGYGDMPGRPLVSDVDLSANETKTYYVVMWVNETGKIQTDSGTYRATIKFESSELSGLSSTFVNYLVGFSGEEDESYFHNTTYKTKIKNISFVDYIDTTNAVESWDMGTLQDGGVIAWVENNVTSGYYDLYIGSNDVIRGLDMSYYFHWMSYVENIDFSNLDTSEVYDMKYMFCHTGHENAEFVLGLGENFDTSNVTNMHNMFNSTGYNSTNFSLDLGEKFDTTNVTNMRYMFYRAGYISTGFMLNLGDKFDTGSVLDMSGMFEQIGFNSTVLTLDLGNKFDTSNVTNMIYMFQSAGKSSTVFTLDLGDKFNTSNVTDMTKMFNYIGNANSNLELDLTTFTFDNVTSYADMIGSFKSTQKIYVKNESDKAWLVDKGFTNVTNSNVIVVS